MSAVVAESRLFPAMKKPLRCTAAEIFYKGEADRQHEKSKMSTQDPTEEVKDCIKNRPLTANINQKSSP